MDKTRTVELRLQVTYETDEGKGPRPPFRLCKELLEDMVHYAIGDGHLTADTELTVSDYAYQVQDLDSLT
jgi:hypothetical protein